MFFKKSCFFIGIGGYQKGPFVVGRPCPGQEHRGAHFSGGAKVVANMVSSTLVGWSVGWDQWSRLLEGVPT